MKNNYEILGETTVIFIKRRNGDVLNTFIDTEDLEKVNSFQGSWYANFNQKTKNFYVVGNFRKPDGKYTLIGLHRFIMDPPDDKFVDHIDRNTLNNKKTNLRIVTLAENNQNFRIQRNNKSGERGVYWNKQYKKWEARVKCNGKFIYLGRYDTLDEAAMAAKEGRKKLLPYAN